MADDPGRQKLFEAAEKLQMEEKARVAVKQARIDLMMRADAAAGFFVPLALKLEMVPDWNLNPPTACTDGTRMFYHPEYVLGQSRQELLGLVIEETLHCAFQHFARRQAREPRRWNFACDCAILQIVKEAGFTVSKDALLIGVHPKLRKWPLKKAAETYYPMIPEDDGCFSVWVDRSGVMDAADEFGKPLPQEEIEALDKDWELAVNAAAQLAKGDLPGALQGLVETVTGSKPNLAHALAEFVDRHVKCERSWSSINRRFLPHYLPGQGGESLGHIACLVDSSGSIDNDQLRTMGQLMEGVLCQYPDVKLTILYHDTRVHKIVEWEPAMGPLILERVCQGGTSHVKPFERVAALPEPPVCCVCLTDLETEFPSKPPGFPVLWCAVECRGKKVPFGQLVEVLQ